MFIRRLTTLVTIGISLAFTLMMGSTSGNLWVTDNGGDDWNCLSNNLADIYCVKFGHG